MKVIKFNEDTDWESKDMGKVKYYNQVFSLFLNKLPSKELYLKYFDDKDNRYLRSEMGDGSLEMQDFINMNLKKEFLWSTGIGIMDAVDIIVGEAISNGNIKINGD